MTRWAAAVSLRWSHGALCFEKSGQFVAGEACFGLKNLKFSRKRAYVL